MTSPAEPYTILVAIQNDATADETMRQGYRLASTRGATELHAVSVVTTVGGTSKGMGNLDRALEAAPGVIQAVVERSAPDEPAVNVIGHVRAHQTPARAIIQLAVDIAADVVVVGTHRRTGLEKLVLGSVAEEVLRGAHCPVLVAIPKAYDGLEHSPSIEPPCPDCLETRASTAGSTYWCARHSQSYRKPHILVPSKSGRNSIMPSV